MVGGGDTALDWAHSLLGVARQVILVHRRDSFRAHEQSVAQVLSSDCQVLTHHELKALHGDDRVTDATIYDNQSGLEQTIAVDAVVLGLGFLANLGPIRDWGLEIVGNAIQVDSTYSTNIPGVYAVGDIATYPGKIKLIAVATAEAATAVNYAKVFLDPSAKASPGHSSDRNLQNLPRGSHQLLENGLPIEKGQAESL